MNRITSNTKSLLNNFRYKINHKIQSNLYATIKLPQKKLPDDFENNPDVLTKENYTNEDKKFDLKMLLFFSTFGLGCFYHLYQKSQVPTFNRLSMDGFHECEVITIQDINHDTKLYKFAAHRKTTDPRIPYHIIVKDDSCQIGRAYSPVLQTPTTVAILVKHYPDGVMSRFFSNTKQGDKVFLAGPFDSMPPYQHNLKKHLGLIAGGTGITPMYQLIKYILEDPEDKTKISLCYANKTPEDVLLKRELDLLCEAYPDRLNVTYTVEKPNWNWKGLTGRLNSDLLRNTLPKDEDSVILVCGPEGLVNAVSGPKIGEQQGPLGGILEQLGYKPNQVYKL